MTLYLTSFLTKTFDRLLPLLKDAVPDRSLCYIPTAADVEQQRGYIEETMDALRHEGFSLQVLDLAQMEPAAARQVIADCRCLMVSGGNTFYLLQELQRKDLLPLIRERVQAGMIYVGESAGSILAAPDIGYSRAMDRPERAPLLQGTAALGLIAQYPVPHTGEEPFAAAAEAILREYEGQLPLVCINNRQFLAVTEDGTQIL